MILDAINYKINIGYKSYKDLIEYLSKYKGNKIALFSDSNVYKIYKDHLSEILEGYDVFPFIFQPGEISKSLKCYHEALTFLSNNSFSRSDPVIAFGGGVVGDLAGFVSSTYLRGLDLIAIPTSLLAMVDSSIGGKNGINLGMLKNQVGTFYYPKHVHIDYLYLETLEDIQVKNGLAEIYKYALLKDANLFKSLNNGQLDYYDLIYRSLKCKLFFVKGDEKDRGKRQFLNLGHTLGHAIEAISDHQVLHGQAVAIGLVKMAILGEILGITKEGLTKLLTNSLKSKNMDTDYPLKTDVIYDIIIHDKKIKNGKINLIFPVDIGKSTNIEYKLEDFKNLLKLL